MEREWQPTTYKRPKKSGIRHPVARLLVLALLLAGFAIRLYQQGGESLWYDETVSAYLAAQPVVDLIQHTARDMHSQVLPLGWSFSLPGPASFSICWCLHSRLLWRDAALVCRQHFGL
jgi:hypothetical protein